MPYILKQRKYHYRVHQTEYVANQYNTSVSDHHM